NAVRASPASVTSSGRRMPPFESSLGNCSIAPAPKRMLVGKLNVERLIASICRIVSRHAIRYNQKYEAAPQKAFDAEGHRHASSRSGGEGKAGVGVRTHANHQEGLGNGRRSRGL